MEDRVLWIAALVVVIGVMWWMTSGMTWKRASNGNPVYVRTGPRATETAEYLDSLRGRIKTFIQEALILAPDDNRLKRIKSRWTGDVSEVERTNKNIAYSIAKADIRVCPRDTRGNLGNPNAAFYVIIHELAHIATPQLGHTPEFWTNMKYLLEMAERVGVYTYDDHSKGAALCDKQLGPSPLSCVKEGTCASELLAPKFLLV